MNLARVSLGIAVIAAGCAHGPTPRPHARARQPAAEKPVAPPPSSVEPVESKASTGDAPSSTPAPTLASTHTAWFSPVASFAAGAVIGRFGDPRDGGRRRHEGIDIAAPRGTAVVAPVAGNVSVSATRSLGGNVVVLRAERTGYELVFSHLDSRLVQRGQRVAAGQVVGTVGTTGNASGGPPHLHFEVHRASGPVDPYPLLSATAATPVRAHR